MVSSQAAGKLERWRLWVEELEDHPLDLYEYEAMLMAREDLSEALEVAGDESVFSAADALDARFQAVTTEDADSPLAPGKRRVSFPDSAKNGWWWSRVLNIPPSSGHGSCCK